jgi:hypothetical protein
MKMQVVCKKYDAQSFADDLDGVIGALKARVGANSDGTYVAHTLPLSFKKGENLSEGISKTIVELMLRKMSTDELQNRASEVLNDAREMLIEKNANYGDSALNPVRIFATASPMEQLLVRIDDKISRLERGQAAGEDVAKDLLGYFLLVLIAKKRERGA